jgi:hypothetical protein
MFNNKMRIQRSLFGPSSPNYSNNFRNHFPAGYGYLYPYENYCSYGDQWGGFGYGGFQGGYGGIFPLRAGILGLGYLGAQFLDNNHGYFKPFRRYLPLS